MKSKHAVSPEKFSGLAIVKSTSAAEDSRPFDVKELDKLVEGLSTEQVELEVQLRRELVGVEAQLRENRWEKGRILAAYREIYRPLKLWYCFCKAVRLSERTALNLINDYVAAKPVAAEVRMAAEQRGLDIAAKKNRKLLAKLVEPGLEGKPGDLLDEAVKDLKSGSRTSPRGLTPDERIEAVCSNIERIYKDLDHESRILELNSLLRTLTKRFDLAPSEGRKPRNATSVKRSPDTFEQMSLTMLDQKSA
jgi:hypothetical protein